MLDLNIIREYPDKVKAAMKKLYTDAPIDDILVLDARRRSLLSEVEQLKAERNAVSRDIGKAPQGEAREAKIAAMKQVGDRIDALDAQVRETEAKLNELMLTVPNLPDESVPVAPDESKNRCDQEA